MHDFTATVEGDTALLRGTFVFGAPGRAPIARGTLTYCIDGNGKLRISQVGAFHQELPYFLPRYGYCLSLAGVAKEISYYGYGPAECYEDKICHAILGKYDYEQDDTLCNWEKPQECGSHCFTDWMTLQCNNVGLRVSGNFSFHATRYDVHEVAAAAHAKDLVAMDHTDLYLDYRMSGVGSNSCGGQVPVKECRINGGEEFHFSITLEMF